MNDDDPRLLLDALRAEHRRLDEEVERLEAESEVDSLELARLKKAKLRLKDEIAAVADETTPDIIA
ncbi:YdcH family protein [Sphingomicrobium astaxanthinifaciens]|uniref:YdcH family protein n=1 Tax=Sphingomicrobium astaxanthinifaciens TaxID=1227949 RepID=UPI001FCCBE92|nr:YdcH family protein [Sphingomicrobium astaxanthinifaciens]MCJ7420313.1 YdcH family protein [Sphingomicrobium astaxanthinifaciens]